MLLRFKVRAAQVLKTAVFLQTLWEEFFGKMADDEYHWVLWYRSVGRIISEAVTTAISRANSSNISPASTSGLTNTNQVCDDAIPRGWTLQEWYCWFMQTICKYRKNLFIFMRMKHGTDVPTHTILSWDLIFFAILYIRYNYIYMLYY